MEDHWRKMTGIPEEKPEGVVEANPGAGGGGVTWLPQNCQIGVPLCLAAAGPKFDVSLWTVEYTFPQLVAPEPPEDHAHLPRPPGRPKQALGGQDTGAGVARAWRRPVPPGSCPAQQEWRLVPDWPWRARRPRAAGNTAIQCWP
eukprot:gene18043-biopygen18940